MADCSVVKKVVRKADPWAEWDSTRVVETVSHLAESMETHSAEH